ncbi:MAG: Methyltransferase type 11 [Acidimicrobiales bacterium]|nr:Methyltransferase type 11 [Acidimicrobiales bacterium]
MGSRWSDESEVPRGADYDARFARLAEQGVDVHGEASLVDDLLREHLPAAATAVRSVASVLDAGCGTGRVAMELARRGHDVVGVDLDPAMLAPARANAPELDWREGDLAHLDLGRTFDAVVLAGNVLIFVTPGTERAVMAAVAAHLVPGGLLVAGFQVRAGGYDPARLDADAAAAGLDLVDRWSTWDRQPWVAGDYQVSLHRRRA